MKLSDILILAADSSEFWWFFSVLAILALLPLLALILVLKGRGGRAQDLELQLAELSGHLKAIGDAAAIREAQLTRTLDERLDQVSARLGTGLAESAEKTGISLQNLHERLAVIDRAQANITELSGEMIGLKNILANKQQRGAFGQARMEAIIRDGLHQSAYSFQDSLSNGSRPDCLIKLPESEQRLAIDAKFPLEAFSALREAENEAARRDAEARVRQDMHKHIKDISSKYLIPGETHEMAILFVPSESIYADLYERFEDVIQKAHERHVIITSPNVLMLIVQTLQAIFKDARMREQAGFIKKEVSMLLDDVGRLKERVLDLQLHFGKANEDVGKILISADKITKRGNKIDNVEIENAPSKPQGLLET